MGYSNIEPLFPLGEILTSPGVIGLGIDINRLLRLHQSGDWGDICPEDIEANEQALTNGEAILSQYPVTTSSGIASIVIVMSEDDRSRRRIVYSGRRSRPTSRQVEWGSPPAARMGAARMPSS